MAVRRKQSPTTQTGGRDATTGVIPGRYALSVGMPDSEPPEGWCWTPLSAVARLESGHTPSRRVPDYWDGDIPWVGIRDATENHGRTISTTNQTVTQAGIDNSSARILPAGTVCLSRTASVGYVIVMGRPMATSQDFVNWVCSDAIDNHFLKYVLLAEHDSMLRFASGTTHQTIYYPEAKAFHVCLPKKAEQSAIAHILGTLDDKIELNRRMNETLEATARALFKSWFVDFDAVRAKAEKHRPAGMDAETAALFPTSFEESPLGLIPKGWYVGNVKDLGAVVCGKTPSTKEQGNFGNDIPFITIPDMHNKIFITRTERSLSLKGAATQAKKSLPANSVCVSCIATPGLVCLTTGQSQTNQQINSVIPQSSISSYFCYWLLRDLGDKIKAGGSGGTVFHNLNTGDFSRIKILLPSSPLVEKFHSACEGIMQRIKSNQEESHTLAALRDALLPKLLSGEIRVSEAEREVGQVT